MTTVHQCYTGQTDGQTDGRHTMSLPVSLLLHTIRYDILFALKN